MYKATRKERQMAWKKRGRRRDTRARRNRREARKASPTTALPGPKLVSHPDEGCNEIGGLLAAIVVTGSVHDGSSMEGRPD